MAQELKGIAPSIDVPIRIGTISVEKPSKTLQFHRPCSDCVILRAVDLRRNALRLLRIRRGSLLTKSASARGHPFSCRSRAFERNGRWRLRPRSRPSRSRVPDVVRMKVLIESLSIHCAYAQGLEARTSYCGDQGCEYRILSHGWLAPVQQPALRTSWSWVQDRQVLDRAQTHPPRVRRVASSSQVI